MYFTSGSNRAFESLMQGKPGFDHYDSGDAGAPEDCGDCRFYRPDWKYQFCVYAECPYQPGKLTAYDAVLFQVKGVDDEMAVFRVEKNRGYTVMSNHHLRNKDLSLKAKGLLSQMLSLPENWDYTLKGLSLINRESIDAIRTAVWELEKAGYITRQQNRDGKGKMADMVYTIYEQPQPRPEAEDEEQAGLENPVLENPTSDIDYSELKNGVREDGTVYAVYSFARKLGQAASSGLTGALLSLVGYTAATAYEPDVLEGVFNISTIVPAVGFLLLGLVLLLWYPLDKKTVDANVIALKKKHSEL